MEFQEFTGKTVSEAVTEASIALGLTSDNIEYEVVSEGSTGLFGRFSKKDAVIRARKKEDAPAKEEVKPAAPAAAKPQAAPAPAPAVSPAQAAPAAEVSAEPDLDSVFTGTEAVVNFIEAVAEKMGCNAKAVVSVDEYEKVVNVDLSGSNTGDLIGKKGQTLDALQYLTSIVANKGSDDYYRLKLDTKNYRERRAKTLENLAKNTAAKVKKTRRKVALEPMNPYERRIIHSYLQDEPGITTKSEGEEPRRRVVVYYKR